MNDSTPTAIPLAGKLLAAFGWVICLMGLAVAFMCVVLAFQIGPWDMFAVAMIGGSLACGVAGGIGFWRYSHAMGGRPRAAWALLFVAVVVAALSAATTGLLIPAFT